MKSFTVRTFGFNKEKRPQNIFCFIQYTLKGFAENVHLLLKPAVSCQYRRGSHTSGGLDDAFILGSTMEWSELKHVLIWEGN